MKDETKIIPDAKLSGELFKITVKNNNDFRVVQNYLSVHKIPFQTLDPRNERPKKFIFRGIPIDTPKEELELFLKEKNFHPIKVAYLTNRKTKKPMPLFMVSVRPAPNIKEIYNINYFNYLKISVEDYKDTDVKQCYNCQSYGHSSLKCFLKPKCVRCAGQHTARDCPLPKEINNATCANCGGPHPANYRGCTKNPRNRNKNIKAVPRTVERTSAPPSATSTFIPAPLPTNNRWNVLANLFTGNIDDLRETDSGSENTESEDDCMDTEPQEVHAELTEQAVPSCSTSKPPTHPNQSNVNKKKNKKKKKKGANKANNTKQGNAKPNPTNTKNNVMQTGQNRVVEALPTPNPPTESRDSSIVDSEKLSKTHPSSHDDGKQESEASDLFNFFKKLLKNINLKTIFDFIKDIIDIFNNNNTMDAVYSILEKFLPLIASFQCHG